MCVTYLGVTSVENAMKNCSVAIEHDEIEFDSWKNNKHAGFLGDNSVVTYVPKCTTLKFSALVVSCSRRRSRVRQLQRVLKH